MASEQGDRPHGPRIDMQTARAGAKEALKRSEFILSRAWGLLRAPRAEWQQIKAEETTIPRILIGYVAPLAAIPPVFSLLGAYFFGGAALANFGQGLVSAFVAWLVGVAMVYLLGIAINAIAEYFDSTPDPLAAQKIAAYALTPFFLSCVVLIWPPLLWAPILALAAMVYLIYRGLPILMRTPEDQAQGYTATVAIAALVTFIIQASVAGCMS